MNKLLSIAALSLLTAAASAQINASYGFASTTEGWTVTGGFNPGWSATANCSGAGGSIRSNIYSGSTTTNFRSPVLTAAGGQVTFNFSYKCADYSANTTPTAGSWGTVHAEWSSVLAGPYTVLASYSNEAQTTACIAKSVNFTPPAGPVYVRVRGVWTAGDFYLNVDDVTVTEAAGACSGTPAPGDTVGPALACDGASFNLSLQNATTGTGVSYQWYSSTVSNTGPWTMLGTANTQSASQSTTTWYYCDVTCATGPSTGSSNVLQVDMNASSNLQTFETGIDGCWSTAGGLALGTSALEGGFGLSTSSVRFTFDGWGSGGFGQQAFLTSPPLTTNPGDRIFFDIAGANWPGFGPDTIHVEESIDNGVTWTTVVTGTNALGGLWNTGGEVATVFFPTDAQWQNHSFALSSGANRVRFRSVSGWGNDCWLDNVVVGPSTFARNLPYGVSCTPGYELSGSPAPTLGTTVTYTASGIPFWTSGGIYASVLILSLTQDIPGTAMSTVTFGTLDSPCLVHVTLAGIGDVVGLYGNAATDTYSFTIPIGAPLGAEIYLQGAAQTDSVFPTNPSGLLTSRALLSHVSNF